MPKGYYYENGHQLSEKQYFFIRKPEGKGYCVWSNDQLDRLIENGTIGDEDIVQLQTGKNNSWETLKFYGI